MKKLQRAERSTFVRRSLVGASMVVAAVLTTTHANAGPGPCVGTPTTASSTAAIKSITATGCDSGAPSGAANVCDNGGSILLARWPSPAARAADSVGGCIFMCTGGDCRVGNDGLPVELLQFGVD